MASSLTNQDIELISQWLREHAFLMGKEITTETRRNIAEKITKLQSLMEENS